MNRRTLLGALGLGAAAGVGFAPPASAAVTETLPGLVPFDSSFGTFSALNTWMSQQTSGAQRPEVKFGTKTYAMDAPIRLRSGHRLLGTFAPAREFRSGTVLSSNGQPTFFQTVPNSQGYPSDGSVRDFTAQGICFSGNAPVLPKRNPDTDTYRGNTQWYTEFRDCGFVGAGPVVSGWGDGLHFTGTLHLQGCTDTAFKLGGSESSICAGQGISFMDSEAMNGTGKPFIEMFSDMWTLGSVMITAQGNCYHLLVSGGESYSGNGRVIGTYFDAPDSAKTQLPAVNIAGGRSLSITAASFHNGAVGVRCSAGSSAVLVEGNIFNDESDVPLLVDGSFSGVVKWGYNLYTGSTPKRLKVSSLDRVICTDPQVTIVDLNWDPSRPTEHVLRAASA